MIDTHKKIHTKWCHKWIWFLFCFFFAGFCCCCWKLHGPWMDVGTTKRGQSISRVRIRLYRRFSLVKKKTRWNKFDLIYVCWRISVLVTHNSNKKLTVKLTYNQMDSHTLAHSLHYNEIRWFFCGVVQIIAFDWALLFAIKLLLPIFFFIRLFLHLIR